MLSTENIKADFSAVLWVDQTEYWVAYNYEPGSPADTDCYGRPTECDAPVLLEIVHAEAVGGLVNTRHADKEILKALRPIVDLHGPADLSAPEPIEAGTMVLCWDRYDKSDRPTLARYREFMQDTELHWVSTSVRGGVSFRHVVPVDSLEQLEALTKNYIF